MRFTRTILAIAIALLTARLCLSAPNMYCTNGHNGCSPTSDCAPQIANLCGDPNRPGWPLQTTHIFVHSYWVGTCAPGAGNCDDTASLIVCETIFYTKFPQSGYCQPECDYMSYNSVCHNPT